MLIFVCDLVKHTVDTNFKEYNNKSQLMKRVEINNTLDAVHP